MIYEGKKITALRGAKGWSMAELARRSRIAQPSLWALEHQRTKQPKAATLMAIAAALGVPLREILVPHKRGASAGDDSADAVMRQLDPQNRAAWLAAGRALIDSQKK